MYSFIRTLPWRGARGVGFVVGLVAAALATDVYALVDCDPLPVEQCHTFVQGAELTVDDVVALLAAQQQQFSIHEYKCEQRMRECATTVALERSLTPMTPVLKQTVRVNGGMVYTDSANVKDSGEVQFHCLWSYDGKELRSLEHKAGTGMIRALKTEFNHDILFWRDLYRPLPFPDEPSLADVIAEMNQSAGSCHTGTAIHPTRGKVLYLQDEVRRTFLDPQKDYILFAQLKYPVVLTVKPWHPGMVASYGFECVEQAKVSDTWVPTKMLYTIAGRTRDALGAYARGRVDEITFTEYAVGKKRPVEDYRLVFPDSMPYYDEIRKRSVPPRVQKSSRRWIFWLLVGTVVIAGSVYVSRAKAR